MTELRRIALLMGQDAKFYREVLLGVYAYASHERRWLFRNAPATLTVVEQLAEWAPDGIIARLDDGRIAKAVLGLGRPTVDTACVISGSGVHTVDVDPVKVGQLAAEYFLSRGYRHFGYFGSGVAHYSTLRQLGFCRTVKEAGFEVHPCHIDYTPRLSDEMRWKTVDAQMEHWLRELAKPVAIFAAHDVSAHDLAQVCQVLGLRVPDDVAILGVDNDELECQLAFPPLSSIAIPAQRIGFEAAKLLDRMMCGMPVANEPLYLPPIHVVTRQSTSVFAVDEPMVTAALHYIRNHLAQPLKVSSIAAKLKVRRRVLDQSFRALLSHSVHDEIRRARVEKAKELLARTDLPMAKVAKQSGFSSPQYLATVFRKVTGLAPDDYRRQTCLPSQDSL
jgi:LacI family transcriptional regulator